MKETFFGTKTEVLGPKYNLNSRNAFYEIFGTGFDLMPFITVAENVGKFLSNRF